MTEKKTNVNILDLPFEHTTTEGMVETLANHANQEEKAFVVTANPEIALAAYKSEEKRALLNNATYITADGIGIVKAAIWTGQSLPERVTGFDLFMRLLERANENKQSIYLLGAKEHVIEKAATEIKRRYPEVRVVGYHHGYFDWNDRTIEEEIQALQPDYVFLALGFPRQERWVSERFESFQKGIFMGIGGSFDVLAGEVKRAPVFWQKINLEWLYRLLQQPSRWKRMLAIPVFVAAVRKHHRKKQTNE
ncbi:WecB/TagA/CpsF family glycosyltransferase [Salsuginibacillus kocurii]|uniref:WecB/TagA/CpsF family glycosyltransferase n=1 Tax=Salsuginibacillus kocurii TaxID=427078 RepID=UPI0003679B9E|nr:WecB/TagA/CpsF family glycosyltransferase [Salsuginibacillus kocurii]